MWQSRRPCDFRGAFAFLDEGTRIRSALPLAASPRWHASISFFGGIDHTHRSTNFAPFRKCIRNLNNDSQANQEIQ